MSPHLPKTAALLAYDSELLSDESIRIVERHLSRCEVCRRELSAIRAYDSIASEIRDAESPELDWSKMEFALRKEARAQSNEIARSKHEKRTGKTLAFGLMAAAACAAAFPFLATRLGESSDSPHAQTTITADMRIDGDVTLASGSVMRFGRDGSVISIGAEYVIHEGDRIVTGPGARLHARIEDGTGFALEPSTDVTFASLRDGAIEIALTEGSLSNRVHHLDTGERYEIVAGAYRAAVRGTHFRVERHSDDVSVAVTEGAVEVTRGSESLAMLRAPNGVWSARGTSSVVPPPREVVLDPSRANVAAAETSSETAAEVAATEEPLVSPRAPVPSLSARDVARVVASESHLLRACFERAARLSPQIERRALLQVDVDAGGRVTSARSSRGTFAPLGECIERVARGFRFPAPRAATSLRVPIDFNRH